MTKVIGVRFRTAGKIYFFDPLNFEIKKGDYVIVETARGIEFGTVVAGNREVEDEKVVQPLKPVIRIANERDMEQEAANKEKEKEAFKICLEKIHKHELEMKLIDAEYTFDNNKVLFYFTADGRIDFRELVKDLASVFKTRIELRQIGVRDETKMVGGIGICGRPLCCHSYLSDFIPVSIKMAKEQNLSLNPTKISGVCGRLMCCLKNEEETYEELNKHLPNIGDTVTTEDGLKGEVQSVNVLRQLVKVIVDVGDEKEIKEYSVEKLHFKRKHGKKEKMDLSKEELQELERLEEEEKQELQEAGMQMEGGQYQNGRNHQGSQKRSRNHADEAQRQQNRRSEDGQGHSGRPVDEEPEHSAQGFDDSQGEGQYRDDDQQAMQQANDGQGQAGQHGEDSRQLAQTIEGSRGEAFVGQDGGYRQSNTNSQEGGGRQANANRQEGGYRQGNANRQGYHQSGANRQNRGYRQSGANRQDGEYRQGSLNRQNNIDYLENRNNQNEGGHQSSRNRQGGYNQSNRNYQNGENNSNSRFRQNGQYQNNNNYQNRKTRYDNRSRRDTRSGQEGKQKSNDNQA